MRGAALGLLLLCYPVHAQNIGWAECSYTRPDEKIVEVRVSLIDVEGNVYSYRTLKGASLKSQVVTFTAPKAEIALGGMQLDCRYEMPGLKSFTNKQIPMWLEPIKFPAGQAPRLGVVVDDSTGFRRVAIGKK